MAEALAGFELSTVAPEEITQVKGRYYWFVDTADPARWLVPQAQPTLGWPAVVRRHKTHPEAALRRQVASLSRQLSERDRLLETQVKSLHSQVQALAHAIQELRDLNEVVGEDQISTEASWIEEHYEALTQEHLNEWVAVEGTSLLASGRDMSELMAIVRAHKPKTPPFITFITREPQTAERS